MPARLLAAIHKTGKVILFLIWIGFIVTLIKPSPLTAVVVAVTPIAIYFYRILNSISKRRKLINELKKKYEITDVKRPISSIFSYKDGENFTVSHNDLTYSVKLISGRKRKIPVVFYPDGHLEYIIRFGIRGLYYEYSKHYTFDYSSEHPKIIVVNPVPRKLHTFHEAKLVDLDNGDKVGEYKIYTATAFLRALELGYISRSTYV